jgi:hypothetical protein
MYSSSDKSNTQSGNAPNQKKEGMEKIELEFFRIIYHGKKNEKIFCESIEKLMFMSTSVRAYYEGLTCICFDYIFIAIRRPLGAFFHIVLYILFSQIF